MRTSFPARIAVLGGGISGLAAAYTLARARQAGALIETILIERSGRPGGVIRSEQVEGCVVEAGPDSFLTEKPEAAQLCRELGLGHALLGSNDAARRTYVLHQERLVPLPEGLMLVVPTRVWPILTTSLLPPRSKLAIVRELFMSSKAAEKNSPEDESVAAFVRRHFGSAMLENIVDPLLAGVYGGDSKFLSARSVLPRFWRMEQEHGSLTRAAWRARRKGRRATESGESPPPLFTTLAGGLTLLVDALERQLPKSGLRLGERVTAFERSPGSVGGHAGGYRVHGESGEKCSVDAVILALPAPECGRLVSGFDPKLGGMLADIPYTSALTVALGFDPATARRLPPGFGFLIPRNENRRLLACTFVHNKFAPHAPAGRALLRCFLGGARGPEVLYLSDAEILSVVRGELAALLKISAEPLFYRIYRWPASMAQYVVGHSKILEAIQSRLEEHPGLFLAGNAYSGIGISDCIRTGQAAAARAVEMSHQ